MLSKKDERLRKKCVDHWFENLMILQLNYYSEYSNFAYELCYQGDSCSFCHNYHNQHCKFICTKCPIKLKTEKELCQDTPWVKVNKMMYHSDRSSYNYYENLFNAIADEINFLLSL